MEKNPFARDVDTLGSYAYTGDSLSSRLANQRMSVAMHRYLDCRGKTVLDIGCGDGTYTYEYIKNGAASVLGIDPVENAVKGATQKFGQTPNLSFQCKDVLELPLDKKYDIAVLRGVLHHMQDMREGIRGACQVAKEVVVMEPNGYNPVLKIIEKTSPYHIAHQEQSFCPSTLRREFRKHGGTLSHGQYIGLVPMFCPDALAKLLKNFEPLVEKIPFVKQIACGQYIMHVQVKR